jgi:hypothetical protein
MLAALSSRIDIQLPTEKEAGWASGPIWTLLRCEKSFVFTGYQTLALQSIA